MRGPVIRAHWVPAYGSLSRRNPSLLSILSLHVCEWWTGKLGPTVRNLCLQCWTQTLQSLSEGPCHTEMGHSARSQGRLHRDKPIT